MTRPVATAIGFVAVLLWALLALLTVGSAPRCHRSNSTRFALRLAGSSARSGLRQQVGFANSRACLRRSMPLAAWGCLAIVRSISRRCTWRRLRRRGSSPIFGPCSSSSSLDSCPENVCVGAISLALVWALPGRRRSSRAAVRGSNPGRYRAMGWRFFGHRPGRAIRCCRDGWARRPPARSPSIVWRPRFVPLASIWSWKRPDGRWGWPFMSGIAG